METKRVVLTLILHEIRASIRNARRRDLAWVFVGGGLLAAYAAGIVLLWLHANAEMLLAAGWLWWAAIPAAMLLSGMAEGVAIARVAQARAHAPFLKAQPASDGDRRQMASYAALRLGAPLIVIDGLVVGAAAAAATQALPLLWGIGAALTSSAGFVAAMTIQLRLPYRPRATADAASDDGRGVSLAAIDRRRPAWIGSWAGGFVAGRVRLSPRSVLSLALFALVGVGLVTAAIVNHTATPAVLGGVIGGVLIFMLFLKCPPLLSPVLRASRLSFTRAVRGLIRLPLALSLAFFAALAVPAFAAEPGMIAMPISGALGLVALNGIYAVFAAFFAHSRRLAVLAFFAALGLTAYESLEYGRTVLLGLAALLIFLWVRARRAYRHGR